NTTVMTDRPNLEMDRISTIPGILATACSIGKVISLSTSGAASVGDTVMTCTWLLVISGRASRGSRVTSMEPHTTSARVNNPMISLFLTEKRMIFCNIIQVLASWHLIQRGCLMLKTWEAERYRKDKYWNILQDNTFYTDCRGKQEWVKISVPAVRNEIPTLP